MRPQNPEKLFIVKLYKMLKIELCYAGRLTSAHNDIIISLIKDFLIALLQRAEMAFYLDGRLPNVTLDDRVDA